MRRIVSVLAAMAIALLLASGVGLLNAVKPAEATFPGTNGRIAYTGYDENYDWGEIYTINAGGGGKFQVTKNDKYDDDPDYSPSGNKIAYSSSDENDDEIYTINATGGTPLKVTNNDTNDYNPDYSPDGKRIAYEGDDYYGGYDREIYTINATGGTPLKVTDNDTQDSEPSWGSRP